MAALSSAFADVVIHVGYHKAGSTLLQRRLFRPERGMYSAWSQDFYHRHILLDRPDSGWVHRIRTAFAPGIEHARRSGLTPVLSCEALSGDIWRTGQANGYGNFHVAEALGRAFPGSRVVLVHREQHAMICSLYKHSVRSHWSYGLEAFLDQSPMERGMAPILNLGYLEFSWLYEHYRMQFGDGNVMALPFELLRHREEWAHRWSEFLGRSVSADWFDQKENRGISAQTARAKRFANYLIPSGPEPNSFRWGRVVNAAAYHVDAHLPATQRVRSDAKLRADVDRLVGDYFSRDNRRMSQLIQEDWSHFGYVTDRC